MNYYRIYGIERRKNMENTSAVGKTARSCFGALRTKAFYRKGRNHNPFAARKHDGKRKKRLFKGCFKRRHLQRDRDPYAEMGKNHRIKVPQLVYRQKPRGMGMVSDFRSKNHAE